MVGCGVIIILAVVLILSRSGGDGVASTPAVVTATEQVVTSGGATGTTPVGPIDLIDPSRVQGFRVAPLTLGSYRMSLVFRLRNTIINGLDGSGSDYVVETAQATRGSVVGLIIAVAAARGATPPNIPGGIRRIIGLRPDARTAVDGFAITMYDVPEYTLAVVDAGPRSALVAIAPDHATAARLAAALASAVAGAPTQR